jgi:hypothetical protein
MIPLDELARQLTALLSPALPYLIRMGKQVGEDLSDRAVAKFGKDAWQWITGLWDRLWPHLSAKESAKETVETAANDPEDEDALEMLRLQLKKLLANEEGLRASAEEHFEAGKGKGVVVTGSHNTVQLGKYVTTIKQSKYFSIGDKAQVSDDSNR